MNWMTTTVLRLTALPAGRSAHLPRRPRKGVSGLRMFAALTVLVAGLTANAQGVRLAIVAEDPSLVPEVEFLTVELSHRDGVQLVERTELRKVLAEQRLASSHGTDFVRLGELLGADGVLLLDSLEKDGRKRLSARLAAVKPGVLLDLVDFGSPVSDKADWSRLVARRFAPLFPKLGVLAKDAVPISFLNLRSSVKSAAGEALERELNAVLIRRLLHRREIFLLERQKLQTLGNEKEFKGLGDAPFWAGGFFLEGTIDKRGYDPAVLTLSARLTPPDKREPIEIEVNGQRSAPLPLLEELAGKILSQLGRPGPSGEWDPAQEASQYLEEAKWALRWRMFPEAQAAADSAWVLGGKDLDGALTCVKAHKEMALPHFPNPDYTPPGNPFFLSAEVGQISPKQINSAVRMLETYCEFSRTLPVASLSVTSAWYAAGVDGLMVASQVLQFFHSRSNAEPALAGPLLDLRALARETAGWISGEPVGNEGFWAAKFLDRPPHSTYYDLGRRLDLLRCGLEFGCYWQDRPEDSVVLYRNLMGSQRFPRLAGLLVFRGPGNPRVVAWRPMDEKRIHDLWQRFLGELDTATNRFWRLDAGCFRVADRQETAASFFTGVFAEHDTLVTNSAARLAFRSELDPFFAGIGGEIEAEYQRRNRGLDDEVGRLAAESAFLSQKQFLAAQAPYKAREFFDTFSSLHYSPPQARELEPLLAAYKTNLVAELFAMTDPLPYQRPSPLESVERVEDLVFEALHPQQRIGGARVLTNREPAPVRFSGLVVPTNAIPTPGQPAGGSGPAPSILLRARFLKLPWERLPRRPGFPDAQTQIEIRGHRICGDQLWLDVHYQNRQENQGGDRHYRVAAAILDLKAEAWEMIEYAHEEDYPSASLEHGFFHADPSLNLGAFSNALFVSEWPEQISKYDLATRRWERLTIPVEKPSRFFSVGDHFYAANDECIVELLDGGHSTRILASCRRRPVVSTLDSLDGYGDITLFPGPGNSLRATVGNRVLAWDGRDWSGVVDLPAFRSQEVFEDAALFRLGEAQYQAELWMLPHRESSVQLCLREESEPGRIRAARQQGKTPRVRQSPIWESMAEGPAVQSASAPAMLGRSFRPRPSAGTSLVDSPSTTAGSNIYILAVECEVTNASGWEIPVAGGRRRSDLVCLARGFPRPLVIPLRFGPDPQPPAQGPYWNRSGLVTTHLMAPNPAAFRPPTSPPWLVFVGDYLVMGRVRLAGVWVIPRSDIAAAVAAERRRQEDRASQ